MFLPLVVDAGEGVKICITESGLENSGLGKSVLFQLHQTAHEKRNVLSGIYNHIEKRSVKENLLLVLLFERHCPPIPQLPSLPLLLFLFRPHQF